MKSTNDSRVSISETLRCNISMVAVLLVIMFVLDVVLLLMGYFTFLNTYLQFAGISGIISIILVGYYIRYKANCYYISFSFLAEILSVVFIIMQALIYAGFYPYLEGINIANLTNATAKTLILQAKISTAFMYIVVLTAILPLKILYLNVLMNIDRHVNRFCSQAA